jgi:hypothetical protein
VQKALLSILAALSFLALAVLTVGTAVTIGGRVDIFDILTLKGPAIEASVLLDGGRFRLYCWRATARGRWSGVSAHLDRPTIRMPDAKRLLWEFDAGREGGSASRYNFVALPVWLPMIPCLVAPTLWLRRRARKAASRGFAVVA